MRCVRLRSGAIELEVVVDRALDLAQAHDRRRARRLDLADGLAAPGLAVPAGWEPFRTFFGGLLTTCGLEHTLGPIDDDATHFHYPGRATHAFPLHGRLSATPGRLLGYGVDWERECVFCRGDVRQAHVFGESLTLEREIRIGLARHDDRARRHRAQRRLRADAAHDPLPRQRRLAARSASTPRWSPASASRASRRQAAQGADWRVVDPPSFPFEEQVWEHTPRPDGGGLGRAAMLNTDIGDGRPLGVELAWSHDTLPRLFQWRVMSDQNYVIGLEPGNAPIEGRARAREEGTLVILEPGEERRTTPPHHAAQRRGGAGRGARAHRGLRRLSSRRLHDWGQTPIEHVAVRPRHASCTIGSDPYRAVSPSGCRR